MDDRNVLPHVRSFFLVRTSSPTCAVPPFIFELSVPILPHVQFQQEYELASLGSFTHPYFFYVPCMWMFFNLFLSSLLHRSFSDVLYPSMISYLIYQNSKTWYLHAPHVNLYLYYYFSYFIQVINHFASFLYSALLIKQGPLNSL